VIYYPDELDVMWELEREWLTPPSPAPDEEESYDLSEDEAVYDYYNWLEGQ
jgi:hypothetical protein